jgi:hypothetical protein
MSGRLGRLIKRFGLTDQSYRFLFEAEPGNEAVSLDCETTGFDPWVDEIVSIAAIRITGRRIHASSAFRALVKPEGGDAAGFDQGPSVAAAGRCASPRHVGGSPRALAFHRITSVGRLLDPIRRAHAQ